WLRVMGILMMNNIPYQEYMDRGYFKLKESLYYTDGVYKTRQTTYVTGKGQRYIIDRLLRDYASEVYEIA
ncbi:MAG: phage antirepressor KilAC domain-containing protein, partial [Ruminococcus sp.]|nr:phage antirepressor KilAC domain-containing protein [Ruminococcus sp.]MBP3798089.1 phage antirepressor KilAC domain-containing protein [Ruminococcus sp.]